LAIDVKTFGSAAPGVSAIKNDLAGTLIAEGKLTEAKQLLDSALEIDRMSDSGGGLGQADIELNMGRLQLANHQERAGEASYRAALAIYRAKQPPGHPDTAFALERLGDLLLKEGRKREAEPLLAEAVTIRQKTLPAGSAKIRASQEMLAQART
jgi:tetratricopeptide (TPR) repeat protein